MKAIFAGWKQKDSKMKWTYDWLLEYLDTKAGATEIADKLTEIGLEVEDVAEPMTPVVAKIIECSDIEGTHLHLLMVDDGAGKRQVVCGAPNCRVGLVGVLARPGCKVGDMEIKVGKIRGFDSNGMMCSEKELGVSDNHEGIMELKETKLGKPWNGKSGPAVFEAKVLANRPDYLAVCGIARDLSATGIGTFKNSAHEIKAVTGKRKAVVKNSERCPVYNFAEIQNIKIAPSSELIQSRLTAIGITPRNAAVDATNYICYDLGQPMHCFDADAINGDIIVRNAKDGEKFTDLFDGEHTLTADDLVITDADGILALAGVVGGKRGMTTDATKNIILESAYFEPLGIRKTRRSHNLNTDSSHRYERGIDPTITGRALALAIEIITKECGGKVVAVTDNEPQITNRVIKYNPAFFKKRIGFDVDAKTQKDILEKLGYAVDKDWNVTQPSWRIDDAIGEKLTSDIIRIYGYGNMPMTGVANVEMSRRAAILTYDGVKTFFAKNRNLIESCSFGFGNLNNEKMVSDKINIQIANPVTDYMNTARNSLIPNMLDAISANEKRGYADLAMFELGTVFDGSNPGEEHKQLVIARTGMASARHWLKRQRPVDVFDVKADLSAYFGDAKTETDNAPMWAHPYRYGRLTRDGKTLGEFGELHPRLAKHWKIKTSVMIGLIDNPPTIHEPRTTNHECNFPPITRDFSFILSRDIPAQDIVNVARNADPDISDVTEFDFYENSIAFQITINPTKNLTDADLLDIQNRVIVAVEKLGAKIRDK